MTDELKAWAEERVYDRAKAKYIEKFDKIRAEIENIYCGKYCEDPLTASAVKEMALDIIDKYKESEDKE